MQVLPGFGVQFQSPAETARIDQLWRSGLSKDPQDAVCLSMLDTLLAVKRQADRVVDPWWDNVPLACCERYLEIYLTASRYEFLTSKPEADVKAFGFSTELSQSRSELEIYRESLRKRTGARRTKE